MTIPRLAFLLFALFLMSCESPHEKISRLQQELLTALGERDYFEIGTGKQHMRLPLPPAPELAESRRIKISEINLETYSFENNTMNETDRKRLAELSSQLNALLNRGNGAFFDPTKCVLTGLLPENAVRGEADLIPVLLEKIPDYYAEVERRWQAPDPKRARMAAEQSLQVLDVLEKMGDDTKPARLAVKDFIGLCHSAVFAD